MLGNHRLRCADARDAAAYDGLLEGAKAEFVFTDPPYNVTIDGNVCGLGRIRHREFAMGCGEMSEVEFTTFLKMHGTQAARRREVGQAAGKHDRPGESAVRSVFPHRNRPTGG